MFFCFVPSSAVDGDAVRLTGPNARHLALALRARPGERVRVRTDGAVCEAEIVLVRPERVELRILSRTEPERPKGPEVVLAQAVIQEKRFDLVLQAASQLGVSEIRPMWTDHVAVVRGKDRWERWRRIVEEACMQAENPFPPVLRPTAGFAEVLEEERERGATLVMPSEVEAVRRLGDLSGVSRVVVLIGPEGGWSAAELVAAEAAGVWCVTLGPRVLRSETAATVALALVMDRAGLV